MKKYLSVFMIFALLSTQALPVLAAENTIPAASKTTSGPSTVPLKPDTSSETAPAVPPKTITPAAIAPSGTDVLSDAVQHASQKTVTPAAIAPSGTDIPSGAVQHASQKTVTPAAIAPSGTDVLSGAVQHASQKTVTPAAITLVSFKLPKTESFAFPAGTTIQELAECLSWYRSGFSGYDAAGNEYDFLADTWSFTAVDPSTPGVYPAALSANPKETEAGRFQLAEGLFWPQIVLHISIQEQGRPDIHTFYAGRGWIIFPWCMNEEQTAQSCVWLYEDGTWKQADENAYCITSCELSLRSSYLTAGKDYKLQVLYPGGQTGILSFHYDAELTSHGYAAGRRDGSDPNDSTVDPPFEQPNPDPPFEQPNPDLPFEQPNPDLPPSNESSDKPESENDNSPVERDSSCAERSSSSSERGSSMHNSSSSERGSSMHNSSSSERGSSFPNPSTPASANAPSDSGDNNADKINVRNESSKNVSKHDSIPVTAPADEPAGGIEYVDGSTLTISGARLIWILERNAKTVSFGWNNVSAEFSKEFLAGLALSAEDMLSLTLTRDDELGIAITLNAKGKQIHSLDETIIRIPVERAQTAYTLTLDDQPIDAAVSYEQDCAVFSISQTGSCRLCEDTVPVKTASQSPSEVQQSRAAKKQAAPFPKPDAQDFLPFLLCTALLPAGGWFLWRKRF